jgi:hypothetical protein
MADMTSEHRVIVDPSLRRDMGWVLLRCRWGARVGPLQSKVEANNFAQ